MIFCIPTIDDRGIESDVSTHFGRAPWFTIFNASTGELESMRNDGDSRDHGACVPTESIVSRGVTGVVCRGIGRGASGRLAAAGISVHLTTESVAKTALEAVLAGRTKLIGGEGACSERGGGC